MGTREPERVRHEVKAGATALMTPFPVLPGSRISISLVQDKSTVSTLCPKRSYRNTDASPPVFPLVSGFEVVTMGGIVFVNRVQSDGGRFR